MRIRQVFVNSSKSDKLFVRKKERNRPLKVENLLKVQIASLRKRLMLFEKKKNEIMSIGRTWCAVLIRFIIVER